MSVTAAVADVSYVDASMYCTVCIAVLNANETEPIVPKIRVKFFFQRASGVFYDVGVRGWVSIRVREEASVTRREALLLYTDILVT